MRTLICCCLLFISLSLSGCADTRAESVTGRTFGDDATTTHAVTQAELDWALQLEKKVSSENYSPNGREIEAYRKIAASLALQTQPLSHPESGKSQVKDETDVSGSELQWALELERQVQSGYQPVPEELNRYELLAMQLQQTQPQSPIRGRNGSDWSRTFTTPSSKQGDVLSIEELEWMHELMQRIQQDGYKPTEREKALYTLLFNKAESVPK